MGDNSVEDRKKAKAEYLAQLAKQKQQQQQQQQQSSSVLSNPGDSSASAAKGDFGVGKTTRDAVLEQRRREFLEKKSGGSSRAGERDAPVANNGLNFDEHREIPKPVSLGIPQAKVPLAPLPTSVPQQPTRQEISESIKTSEKIFSPQKPFESAATNEQSDKALQRARQDAYARQLQQDQLVNNARQTSNDSNQRSPPRLHVSSQSGPGNISDMESRVSQRAKQDEYARQLQRDQEQQRIIGQSNTHIHDYAPRVSPRQSNNPSGMGGILGGRSQQDDRSAQRAKQEEYARQLQQDQLRRAPQLPRDPFNPPLPHQNDHLPSNSVRLAHAPDDKTAMRMKHDEYARQLQMDQLIQKQIQQREQSQAAGFGHHGNISTPMSGADRFGRNESDRSAVRAKQEEYARQLQQDRLSSVPVGGGGQSRHPNAEAGHHPYDGGAPNVRHAADFRQDDRITLRQKQEVYSKQLQDDQFIAGMMSNAGPRQNPMSHQGGFDRGDEKHALRAKQEEYARQLQFDQAQKSRMDGGGAYGSQRSHQYPSSQAYPSQAPSVNDGYVIGPLGLPVRRTLEVGQRGKQKAYNMALLQQAEFMSPTKPYPEHDNYNYQHPSIHMDAHQQQLPPVGAFNAAPVVSSALPLDIGGMDLQAEREAKARLLKLEHARALEQQILENKMRIEMEKKVEEEKERKIQERVEQERRELEMKFAEEKRKAGIEDERKRELAVQIEEKKKQKELDVKKEQDLEERETAKAIAGAAELARREHLEIEREKNSGIAFGAKAPFANPEDDRPIHAHNPATQKVPEYLDDRNRINSSHPPDNNESIPKRSLFAPPSPEIRVKHEDGIFERSPRRHSEASGGNNSLGGAVVVPMSPGVKKIIKGGLFDGEPDDDEGLEESLSRQREKRKQQQRNEGEVVIPKVTYKETTEPANSALLKKFQNEAERAKQEALEAKRELDKMRKLLQEKERASELASQHHHDQHVQHQSQKPSRHPSKHPSQDNQSIDLSQMHAQPQLQPPHYISPQKPPAKPFAGIFEKNVAGSLQPSHGPREHDQLHHSMSASDLNSKTLKSDSRFVFPDGTAFVPNTVHKNSSLSTPDTAKRISRSKPSLSPMKDGMKNPDFSDKGEFPHENRNGKVQLPPRNIIRKPQESGHFRSSHEQSNDDTFGRDIRQYEGGDFSRPSTVAYSAKGRRRADVAPDSPNVTKKTVRRFINSKPATSTEGNKIQFFNDGDIGSDETIIHSRRARRDGGSGHEDLNGSSAEGNTYDVDGALRKNRRKLNFLSNIRESSQTGMDELDMLLSLNDITSRPSTTASTRPATMQGNSKFIPQNKNHFPIQESGFQQSRIHHQSVNNPHFASDKNQISQSNSMDGTMKQLDSLLDRISDNTNGGVDPFSRGNRPITAASQFSNEGGTIGTETVMRLSKDLSSQQAKQSKNDIGLDNNNHGGYRPTSGHRNYEKERQTIKSAGRDIINSGASVGNSMEFLSPRSQIPVPVTMQPGTKDHNRVSDSSTLGGSRVTGNNHSEEYYIDFSEFGF